MNTLTTWPSIDKTAQNFTLTLGTTRNPTSTFPIVDIFEATQRARGVSLAIPLQD